jgi:hypothetical protein
VVAAARRQLEYVFYALRDHHVTADLRTPAATAGTASTALASCASPHRRSNPQPCGCGGYLLTQLQVVPNTHLWVYIPTGIGGLILTYLLFVSRLVPRPIAVLGIVGYALLLLGVLLDLLGVLDIVAGAGLVLVVPGGLFEFVVLPIWLIAKGFNSTSAAVPTRATGLVTAN